MIQGWKVACAVAGLAAAAGAGAAELPATQEGLWEVRVQTTTKPVKSHHTTWYKVCRDHAFDQAANDLWSRVQGCTASTEALGPGKYTLVSRCASRGTVIAARGTLRYDGTTARHIQNQVTYTPPISGKTGVATLTDEKYLGACPAELKPGDRIGADGEITRRAG